jgi:hypothetical protein
VASHLHTPSKNGTTENVIILLNAGADVNPRGESDLTPLGYAKGFRERPVITAIPTALTAPRPSSKIAPAKSQISTPPKPKAERRVGPASMVTDYGQDDPSDDPIFLAERPHDPPEAVFLEQKNSQPQKTTSKGQSMMYGRDYLRAELGI